MCLNFPGGTKVGPYEILDRLGQGGMGEVYRARDTRLGREVAFKVLGEGVEHDPDSIARFQQEARLAGALNHPNVLTVYDVGEHDRKPFLVSELLEGETLRELLDAGSLPRKMALRLALQLAQGLSAAHGKGIVHRDLKPENVFVTLDGRAKILDFGIAKLTTPREGEFAETPQTAAGQLIGTLAYMSPERLQGEHLDARSDLFSFGCVLFEMFCGCRPFAGKTAVETGAAILHDEPGSIDQVVPPALANLMMRCLRKRVEERISSAQEAADALEQLLANEQTPHPRSEQLPQVAQLARKSPAPKGPGADTRIRALVDVLGRAVGERTAREAMRSNPKPDNPVDTVPPAVALSTSRWPRLWVGITSALAVAAAVLWLVRRESRIHWAREEAIPQIAELIEHRKFFAAVDLAEQVERVVPTDPALVKLWPQMTRVFAIETEPAGADIAVKEYSGTGTEWRQLGRAPLEGIRLPLAFFRWRITKAGFEPVEAAPTWREGAPPVLGPRKPGRLRFKLDAAGTLPPGMVRVRGGKVDTEAGETIEDFFLDRFEVTNRQFKAFVDAGGYRRPELWKHEFVLEGRVLKRQEALALLRDRTGRPGPSTWASGDFPEGEDAMPVTGVSWYEAAAYAAAAGKSLPTIEHWRYAAGQSAYASLIPSSNFSGAHLAPVGSFTGLGPYGTYDMAGNAKEWCWNASGDKRHILGGAFDEPPYMFGNDDARSPFNRSAQNGFRLAKYLDESRIPKKLLASSPLPTWPDFSGMKPISDEVFKVFKSLYSYDRSELMPVVDSVDDSSGRWRKEKVTVSAAYGNERLSIFLFTPRHAKPPYQTVVYFPGSWALHLRSSEELDGMELLAFIIKSGRAVVYPVYKSTYERGDGMDGDFAETTTLWRDHVVQWTKDVERTLDWVETRPDLDHGKIALYGFSWGAALLPIFAGVDERIKVGVLLAGGCYSNRSLPEADAANFAGRVRQPMLMVNGRFDFAFPYEAAQVPLFRLLGTAPKDKRHAVFEGGHRPTGDMVTKEILDWLDRYLGPSG